MLNFKKFQAMLAKKAETRFTIKGINEYRKDEKGEYGMNPKIFKTYYSETFNKIDLVYEDNVFGRYMNIEKVGPTTVTFSTYDILGGKTTKRIKLNQIKIK